MSVVEQRESKYYVAEGLVAIERLKPIYDSSGECGHYLVAEGLVAIERLKLEIGPILIEGMCMLQRGWSRLSD